MTKKKTSAKPPKLEPTKKYVRVFKTVPFDKTGKVEYILDHKTTIIAKPGKSIDKLREKYLKK